MLFACDIVLTLFLCCLPVTLFWHCFYVVCLWHCFDIVFMLFACDIVLTLFLCCLPVTLYWHCFYTVWLSVIIAIFLAAFMKLGTTPVDSGVVIAPWWDTFVYIMDSYSISFIWGVCGGWGGGGSGERLWCEWVRDVLKNQPVMGQGVAHYTLCNFIEFRMKMSTFPSCSEIAVLSFSRCLSYYPFHPPSLPLLSSCVCACMHVWWLAQFGFTLLSFDTVM